MMLQIEELKIGYLVRRRDPYRMDKSGKIIIGKSYVVETVGKSRTEISVTNELGVPHWIGLPNPNWELAEPILDIKGI